LYYYHKLCHTSCPCRTLRQRFCVMTVSQNNDCQKIPILSIVNNPHKIMID